MGKESKTKIEDIQKKNNVFDWLKSNKDNLNIFFNFHGGKPKIPVVLCKLMQRPERGVW